MSRVANNPIKLPSGVTVTVVETDVTVKGAKGTLHHTLPVGVKIKQEEGTVLMDYNPSNVTADMLAGTTRAVLNNLVEGVSKGFERKLTLVGVGYRAQAQGKKLNLSLGFSHPVVYSVPEGITIETPTQTEIVVKGISKHLVGQVAAKIREFRRPEPYKGKGIRYSDEKIQRKEAKKK